MNHTIPQPQITYLGVDLSKKTFHACGMTRNGRVVLEKRFTRTQLERFAEQLPPCRIGLEACGSAHHWARLFRRQGHDAQLISPHFVKPFVKSNKNDARDAEAIGEAVSRPNMRFAPVRTEPEQAIQQCHRMRERLVHGRTRLVNQLRSFLYEYGVVVPVGIEAFRKRLPEILEDGENDLLPEVREMLADGHEELLGLDARVEKYHSRLRTWAEADPVCQRLMTVPGIGALSASALAVKLGDGSEFRNGREAAAYLGLVPRQYSTGGKPKLGGISKRGDRTLRSHLVLGAQAVLQGGRESDARRDWAGRVAERHHRNVAAVAVANKNVRIAWALLRRGGTYRREAPMA